MGIYQGNTIIGIRLGNRIETKDNILKEIDTSKWKSDEFISLLKEEMDNLQYDWIMMNVSIHCTIDFPPSTYFTWISCSLNDIVKTIENK